MIISKRDKIVLMAGGVFLLFFVCIRILYFPAVEKRDDLLRALDVKKEHFNEMITLKGRYQSLSKHNDTYTERMKKRDRDFSLFSFVDRQAEACGIKTKVAYMKPFSSGIDASEYQRATVKIKLNKLYLQELIDFLYKVESPRNGVRISSLSLDRTGKKDFFLDVLIETETLVLKDAVL